MKKLFKKLKSKKGYISIEVIIVAGLLLSVGVVSLMAFQSKANKVTKNSLTKVEEAANSITINDLE